MKAGLYHPETFKDNCGFGLIAHMQGEPSHQLLQTAIEALTCMTHRGGINADGKTGDGCGLLIQKPDLFLRAVAREAFSVDLPEQYAVGMVFFNQDPVKAEAARENMNREIVAAGLELPPSIRTLATSACRPRSAYSTSASPPTPCRNGRWRSRSASSPTTARSTPSPATATGPRRGGPSSPTN